MNLLSLIMNLFSHKIDILLNGFSDKQTVKDLYLFFELSENCNLAEL